jgi:hypothetical protein
VLELVVSMGTALGVIAATLSLLFHSAKIGRAQMQVAEMQDSLRKGQQEVIRYTRMAGRGGLPLGVLPDGIALAVDNDAPTDGDGSRIAIGDADSPRVLAGTDVLVVRGVMSTPVYHANPMGDDFALDDPEDPSSGTLRLFDPHPVTAMPQDLERMVEALEGDDHPALLLVSPLDTWAVVEIDLEASSLDWSDGEILLAFDIGNATGSATIDRYAALSGGFSTALRTVATAGLLEEYRFYVRQEQERADDPESLLVARLGMLRFQPNTETLHPANSDYSAEIADNVLDLQVAVGVDRDTDGEVAEGEDADERGDDEWLFNAAADVDADGDPIDVASWNPSARALHYLRVTTIARTDRPDAGYGARELGAVEDRDYTASSDERLNGTVERRFRRRAIETVVDMRNM